MLAFGHRGAPYARNPAQVFESLERARSNAELAQIREDNYRRLKAAGYFDLNRNRAIRTPSFDRGSQYRFNPTNKALPPHQNRRRRKTNENVGEQGSVFYQEIIPSYERRSVNGRRHGRIYVRHPFM